MKNKMSVIGQNKIVLSKNEGKFIRPHGRYTIKDECLAFDWPNSGFSFNFFGTGFILSLGKYESAQPAYIKVYVDNIEQRFAVCCGKEKIIFEHLPNKRHKVTVLKITEGAPPVLFSDLVLLGSDQKLMSAIYGKNRRIEFIGDSITCGYGTMANSTETAYNTFQQDSSLTYAFFTAKELDAEANYICVSGKGIVSDCEGNRAMTIPEFYNLASLNGESWDFSGYTPDVVVINAGTNDAWGMVDYPEFIKKSSAFIKTIREKYPQAYIIWLYGMLNQQYLTPLKDMIKEMNEQDPKIHFVYVEGITESAGEIGGVGHPNAKANKRAANLLVKKIKSVTGWR